MPTAPTAVAVAVPKITRFSDVNEIDDTPWVVDDGTADHEFPTWLAAIEWAVADYKARVAAAEATA